MITDYPTLIRIPFVVGRTQHFVAVTASEVPGWAQGSVERKVPLLSKSGRRYGTALVRLSRTPDRFVIATFVSRTRN